MEFLANWWWAVLAGLATVVMLVQVVRGKR